MGLKHSVSLNWTVSAQLHETSDSWWNMQKSSPEDPMVVKVLLEHLEQDMAPKDVLVIHYSLAVSRHNSSSCHWIKTSQAERVGLPLCTGLLTIKLSRTGQFCNSSHHHRIRWTTTIYHSLFLSIYQSIYLFQCVFLSLYIGTLEVR